MRTNSGPALSERSRRPSESKGFTLIEVLIALLITTIAVTTLLGLRAGAIESTAETRDARVAWELAAAAMGESLAVDSAEWDEFGQPPKTWTPEEGRIPHADQFHVTVEATPEEVRVSEDPDKDPELIFKVTVTVQKRMQEAIHAPEPVRLVSYFPFGGKKK